MRIERGEERGEREEERIKEVGRGRERQRWCKGTLLLTA